MLILDSNHTHDHVLAELRSLAPLLPVGGMVMVADTLVEEFPEDHFAGRPWGRGDNPLTAVPAFLAENDAFAAAEEWDRRALVQRVPRRHPAAGALKPRCRVSGRAGGSSSRPHRLQGQLADLLARDLGSRGPRRLATGAAEYAVPLGPAGLPASPRPARDVASGDWQDSVRGLRPPRWCCTWPRSRW